MNIITAPGQGSRIKYTEDFSITLGAGVVTNSLVLGQAVDFNKTRLFWMGCSFSSNSPQDDGVRLEFNGTQTIIATRVGSVGITIVNAMIEEYY